jgi:thiol-disulfide isomerase/thioredoxin
MKRSLTLGLITVLTGLCVQCAPTKPAEIPAAGEPRAVPEIGKAAAEIPAEILAEKPVETSAEEQVRRVTRAFADAGLPVLRQRVAPPDFSASRMDADQGSITLGELKGKVVFLNFWATWCGPCRAEMPSMEVLYQRFKESGLEIVAVNYRENRKTVDTFTEQFNLSFPVTLDPAGRINGLYGIEAFPTTFIIDREGKIVTRVVGSLNWNTPELFVAFETLLDFR